MSFIEGQTIGSYRIIEQLGQGGMATVFKAYHASLDRFVAIKALHPAFKEDPNFLARFQREARLVAKLDHPNIVPIFDFSEHEGRPYLVIKYIEGETLKARISRGPLSRAEILKVIEAVGGALSYAHRQGILHRDVKPSNVLLANDGGIFLADFGLARIAEAGESTISSDMLLGTPQYISPEQAVGKRDLDDGTDIYSFGVLIYEMLVGKVPFSADTPYAIIHDHIYTPLPLPSRENPSVSPAAERQLLRALAKERADRFADVAAMVAEFKDALSGEPEPLPLVPLEMGSLAPALEGDASTRIGQPPVEAAPPAEGLAFNLSLQPDPTPTPADFPAKVKRARKPRKWLWWVIVPGVILMCLCSLLTANQAVKDRKISFPGGLPFLRQTGAPPAAAEPTADTTGHLALALDYLEEGSSSLAIEELQTAAGLAGDDIGFYRTATAALIEEEQYIPAAWLSLHALETLPDPPADLVDAARQTIYLAYDDERAPAYLPYDDIAAFDPALRDVAEVRLVYFANDEPVRAQALMARLLLDYPRNPEARLLEAEIQVDMGNIERAQAILQNLVNSADTPRWILDLAKENLP